MLWVIILNPWPTQCIPEGTAWLQHAVVVFLVQGATHSWTEVFSSALSVNLFFYSEDGGGLQLLTGVWLEFFFFFFCLLKSSYLLYVIKFVRFVVSNIWKIFWFLFETLNSKFIITQHQTPTSEFTKIFQTNFWFPFFPHTNNSLNRTVKLMKMEKLCILSWS